MRTISRDWPKTGGFERAFDRAGQLALALWLLVFLAVAIWGAVALAQADNSQQAVPAAAAAAAAKATIDIGGAWTRATPAKGGNAAVYLRIVNAGKNADALNGVETENAEHAMVHATTTTGGVTRMEMTPSLPVPASSTVTLAPGGRHIMLEGLKAPLREGESFIITLVFAHAGRISATVKVMNASATGPAPETAAAPPRPAPGH
jgi:periplasmic copper chaperone A